jgi:iron-sulfur cluster insertion protein
MGSPLRLFYCSHRIKAHVASSVTLAEALNSRVNRYTLNIEFGEKTMSAVAENIETEMPEPINFTDSAAAKVADLIAEEGNPDLKLRVFVQGGGCSGFQYGFTFDEVTNEDDTTMTKNGVSLLIDAMSYQYLLGAEIDYKEDLQGAQFVIKNPNATTTCGCGSSFSV